MPNLVKEEEKVFKMPMDSSILPPEEPPNAHQIFLVPQIPFLDHPILNNSILQRSKVGIHLPSSTSKPFSPDYCLPSNQKRKCIDMDVETKPKISISKLEGRRKKANFVFHCPKILEPKIEIKIGISSTDSIHSSKIEKKNV